MADLEHTVESTSKVLPWDPKIISILTALFFVPGGILYALNFERLGHKEKKVPNLITFSLLSSVLIFASLLSEARLSALGFVISMAYAIHFYKSQNHLYKKHLQNGGQKASLGMPVLITAISLCALVLISYSFSTIIDSKFNKAQKFYEIGDLINAEKNYKIYKKFNRSDPAPYYNLALVYIDTGRIDLAKSELEAYLKLNRSDNEARELLEDLSQDRK